MKLHFQNSQGKLNVKTETSENECNAAIKQILSEYEFTVCTSKNNNEQEFCENDYINGE